MNAPARWCSGCTWYLATAERSSKSAISTTSQLPPPATSVPTSRERISEELTGLVGVIAEIRALEVGADVAGGGNWDVVLIADFDDL